MKEINLSELPELEKLMLHKIYCLNSSFNRYFENYDFHNLYKDLLNFCTVDLSAFYFDIRKDTLYCDPLSSQKRKSTLLVLNIILQCLLKWFAPILSFTTEEIYQLVSKKKKSIHLENFLNVPKKFENLELNEKWSQLLKIRDVCNLSIEEKRASKEIGSSLEAAITIKINKQKHKILKGIDFAELCITSLAEIKLNDTEEIEVQTNKAQGNKCPVCWKISTEPCQRHGH